MAIMDYPRILNDRSSKDVMKYSKMRMNPFNNIIYYLQMISDLYLNDIKRIFVNLLSNL